MKKIRDDFSRTLSIKFDIDSDISYKDFCNNKDYQDHIEIIDNHFVLEDGYHWIRNLLCIAIPVSIEFDLGINVQENHLNFIKLIGDLLEFDLKETFQNLSRKKINKIQKLLDDQNSIIEMDAIDIIQTLLVRLDKLDTHSIINESLLVKTLKNKQLLDAILLEIRKTYYSVKKAPNKRLYYAVFQILIQKNHVFFVYDGRSNVTICSAESLHKNLHSVSIVYDLTLFLYDNISSDIKTKIIYLKGEFQSNNSMDLYFKEIVEQFETIKNIEINVLSKEFDTDKRGEIDKTLPNADIGFKKHKGQKQYIKVERKFKLKKP